jgi:hypothetical protein
VRTRSVALVTRDPALYLELAGFLRERRVPSVSLLPGDQIPDRVAIVLTSREERAMIRHSKVLSVGADGDRRALGAAIEQALGSPEAVGDLIVGIDPGPRPGYAILAGSRCIGQGSLEAPEAAGPFATHLRRTFPSHHLRFRVGAGDPLTRNRVVNALLRQRRMVEMVSEHGSTPRGRRRPRDGVAALTIASSPGVPVREPLAATITEGEISNLQRLSREGSGGRVTISRGSAHRVLRGELTLAQALDEAMGRTVDGKLATPPRRVREPL